MTPENKAFFEGLQALSDSDFPKKCSNCGRLYHSPKEFLARSQAQGSVRENVGASTGQGFVDRENQ